MFLLFSSVVALATFFYLDGYHIVKNTIHDKYKKYKILSSIINGKDNTQNTCEKVKLMGKVCFSGLKLAIAIFWIMFVQKINKSVVTHRNKHLIHHYAANGRLYKIAIKPRKGPHNVLLVTDENSEDVTEEVIPFVGPNNDWHGKSFTPTFWDKKSLTFEMHTGETKHFTQEEDITL